MTLHGFSTTLFLPSSGAEMTEKPKRLGRGLEALMGSNASTAHASPVAATPALPESPLRDIPLASIAPNPFQPRRSFKPEELTDLANSIRASGLLQPVTVRITSEGRFELVSGERRLRAVARLGWPTVPAIVKPFEDRDMLVLALVENLQRADLNPLDEALGFQRLIDEFGHTQQQVADSIGKDRSTVANLLRVLSLPEGIQRMVRDEQLTLGHARALLGLPNERAMLDAARLAVEQHLSVREVERMSQQQRPAPSPAAGRAPVAPTTPRTAEAAEVRRLTELLRRKLQTDVTITLQPDARGTLAIAFYSVDDLHRVIERVLGPSYNDV